MNLPITATKTLNQWFHDNPTFYDEMLLAGDIDEATIGSIHKWYGLRILCDDDNFDRFYERQLELALPRYNKLIRLENTEFDAMVNSYKERQVLDMGSEQGSETSEKTTGLTATENIERDKSTTERIIDDIANTKVRTPNITVEDEGSTSSTSNTDTESHTEGGTTSNGSNVNVSVSKQNPQSISYGQAAVGSIPNLNWEYPSAQSQSEGNNTGATTSDNDSTGSTDTTQSGTSGNTQTTTGTDTNVETGQNVKNKTGSEEDSESRTKGQNGTENNDLETLKTNTNTRREQLTGREGLTPQAALREAMSYVKTSSAFAWLKEQLEICFLSVYDI